MTDTALVKLLSDLFEEVDKAHQSRFEARERDPEWPLWYADFLMERLRKRLKADFTKSELVYLLVKADREREFRAPGSYWPTYCAKFFYERYL